MNDIQKSYYLRCAEAKRHISLFKKIMKDTYIVVYKNLPYLMIDWRTEDYYPFGRLHNPNYSEVIHTPYGDVSLNHEKVANYYKYQLCIPGYGYCFPISGQLTLF